MSDSGQNAVDHSKDTDPDKCLSSWNYLNGGLWIFMKFPTNAAILNIFNEMPKRQELRIYSMVINHRPVEFNGLEEENATPHWELFKI